MWSRLCTFLCGNWPCLKRKFSQRVLHAVEFTIKFRLDFPLGFMLHNDNKWCSLYNHCVMFKKKADLEVPNDRIHSIFKYERSVVINHVMCWVYVMSDVCVVCVSAMYIYWIYWTKIGKWTNEPTNEQTKIERQQNINK